MPRAALAFTFRSRKTARWSTYCLKLRHRVLNFSPIDLQIRKSRAYKHGYVWPSGRLRHDDPRDVSGRAIGPMHPSERGKGKHWAQWKNGTCVAKPRNPYDFLRIAEKLPYGRGGVG